MRNSTDAFIESVQAYLKSAFSERAEELGIEDIVTWDRGWNSVLSSLSAYPAALTFIDSKTLKDCYTTEYSLIISIAVTSDDDEELEELGNLWADILEDSIRSNWHLGGACLDSSAGEISFGVTKGIYCIYMRLDCDVDIGGYVYEKREESDALSEMQVAESEESDVGTSEHLSQVRAGTGTGEQEEQEQTASDELEENIEK